MNMIATVCHECSSSGTAALPDPSMGYGFLACPNCGRMLKQIDVTPMLSWVDRQVRARATLNTRKQSTAQSDSEISREGIAAELASAALLCPANFGRWMTSTEQGGNNRGRDLTCELTGLDKPVETKQTRYRSERTGCLIVRPPRWTPGPMRVEYLDDSYYVLLIGQLPLFRIAGWIDRARLVSRGQLNPVPCNGHQRQCWGVHWQKLDTIEALSLRLSAAVTK